MSARKALTVKQPWAWAIISGGKTVENRARKTNYRGALYIHAGKTAAPEALDFPAMREALGIAAPTELHAGYIIGTVDLIDCHHAHECALDDEEGRTLYCSEWAMADTYHWVLANPRPIACPFPETGKLGLWNMEAAS